MHARVSFAQVQPGKMDDLVSRLRGSVYPDYKQQQGFKGALMLTDPNTGKAISITLWETEADLTAGWTSTEELRDRLDDLMAAPRVREVYKVSFQDI